MDTGIKKYIQNIFCLSTGVFIIGILFGVSVFAQEQTDLKSTLGNIKDDVSKIEQTKDVTTSFQLRKQALIKIINFTNLEIAQMRARISSSTPASDDETYLQSQFLSKLDFFSSQLHSFSSVLNNVRTLAEIKGVATSLKGWRENYLSEIKKMNDFLAYYQLSSLLGVVNERYQLIKSEVGLLPVQPNASSSIEQALEGQQMHLDRATELLQQAHKMIIDFYLDRDYKKVSQKDFIDPDTLFLEAVQNLKDAYLSFFELGLLVSGK